MTGAHTMLLLLRKATEASPLIFLHEGEVSIVRCLSRANDCHSACLVEHGIALIECGCGQGALGKGRAIDCQTRAGAVNLEMGQYLGSGKKKQNF